MKDFLRKNNFVKLLDSKTIDNIVYNLADHISGLFRSPYFYNNSPLHIIGIMNGAFMFMSDLSKHLSTCMKAGLGYDPDLIIFDTMRLHLYSNANNDIVMPSTSVKSKNVIVLDTVYDSGKTIHKAVELLLEARASSVKMCCLLKKQNVPNQISTSYSQYSQLIAAPMSVDNKYLIGYGLDYKNGNCRYIKDIWQQTEPVIKSEIKLENKTLEIPNYTFVNLDTAPSELELK